MTIIDLTCDVPATEQKELRQPVVIVRGDLPIMDVPALGDPLAIEEADMGGRGTQNILMPVETRVGHGEARDVEIVKFIITTVA
ncbi:hypothetical protein [Nisaea nitritireducens]|uniref:hypothetical protein n=1 Tax=Nisaea nitritireducens TaxID=568392 RepID=UPI0018669B4A|nr:hypothetical protein [Nisaea nitritireducens]